MMSLGSVLFKYVCPLSMVVAAYHGRWEQSLAMYLGCGMLIGYIAMDEAGTRVGLRFAFAWLPAVWSQRVAAWCRCESKEK